MKRYYYILICIALLMCSASSFAQKDQTAKLLSMHKRDSTQIVLLTKQLKAKQAELAEVKAQLDRQKPSSSASQSDIERLMQMNEDLTNAKVEIRWLRTDTAKYAHMLAQVKAQLDDTQKRLADANAELTKLRNSTNASKVTAAEKKVQTLEAKVKSLEDLIAKNKREYDAVIAQKNSEILKLRQEIESARNTNERIKQAEAERDRYKEELQAMKTQLSAMQRELDSWKAIIEIRENTIEQLQTKLKKYE